MCDSRSEALEAYRTAAASDGNRHRLIHASGPLTIPEVTRDPELGVSVRAARLYREVEMYQTLSRRPAADPTRVDPEYFEGDWRARWVHTEQHPNPPYDITPLARTHPFFSYTFWR